MNYRDFMQDIFLFSENKNENEDSKLQNQLIETWVNNDTFSVNVEIDIQTLELLKTHSEINNPCAQYVLASIYEDGIYSNNRGVEVTPDVTKAFEWYLRSANNGIHRAQLAVAYFYLEGTHGIKNYRKAIEWYEKIAYIYPFASTSLGDIYNYDSNYNYDFDDDLKKDLQDLQDHREAFRWYNISMDIATKESHGALYELYDFYHDGDKGIPINYQKCVELVEKAIEFGDSLGYHLMGLYYYEGFGDIISIDYKKAIEYFEKAGNHEEDFNPQSQYYLSRIYKTGGYGIEPNYELSDYWYAKAKDNGGYLSDSDEEE